MTVVLLAPSERGHHVTYLEQSGLDVARNAKPEAYGCDVLWSANGAFYGVQRKAVADLVASMDDGRLAKESAQIKQLGTRPWLVVEGRVAGEQFTAGLRTYSTAAFYKSLMTLGDMGWEVVRTEGARDTGVFLVAAVEWTKKAKHGTASSRPKVTGKWGKASNREYQAHLLQGFDGVGPEVARAIVEKFGGAPMGWLVGVEELMEVDGVGKVRAARLIESLGNGAGMGGRE